MDKKSTASAKSEAKVVSKKASVKKAKLDEVEENEDHVVEEPNVKKTKAKATVAKTSASVNTKKRALASRVEEESSESEEEVKKPAAKKSKASGAKAATAKRTNAKKIEEDSESSSDESYSGEEEPVKSKGKAKTTGQAAKTSSSAKTTASAKKTSTSAKKSANAMDVSEDKEEEVEEKPKKASEGKKATAAAKKTAEPKSKKDKAGKEEGGDDGEGDAEDAEEAMEIPPTDFSTPVLAPNELKLVSWNVASFRAVQKKGFEDYIKKENPDVICLQETKIPSATQSLYGYHAYFSGCKAKPGLHGTGILSKEKPIKVDVITTLDEEGRVLVAEFEKFFLLNTYVPQSGQKLERIPFRLEWDKGLHALFLSLQKTKPVLWCGDLNVAHQPIDLANPKGNKRTAGFTDVERKSFDDFITTNKLVDTYRSRHPEEKDCYSFWTYKRQSRSKNIGWRMDYFIASPTIDSSITQAYIRKHIHGSDHCPVIIHIKK